MTFEQWCASKNCVLDGAGEETVAAWKVLYEAEIKACADNGGSGGDSATPPDKTPPIEASAQPPDVQGEIQRLRDAHAAEMDRISAIQAECGTAHAEIAAQAIRGGWDVEKVKTQIELHDLRASRSEFPGIHVRSADRAGSLQALEAGLCARAGIDEAVLLADYGEPVVEAAHRNYRDIGLQQLFAECARMDGKSVHGAFGNDTIRAAFSTVTLPGILSNTANKRLLRSFQAQPLVATRLCAPGDLNDFKEASRYRLNDTGDLQPVAADGELQHGGQSEDKATNQLDTYGKLFTLTRKMSMNDDLGAFLRIPDAMGVRAARKLDQLFFTRLLSNPTMEDSVALFQAATHKNYATGAATALSETSIKTATTLFEKQTDADSQPISVSPRFLLCPSTLKLTAIGLVKSVSLIIAGTTDSVRGAYNAIADLNLEVVSAPHLETASYTGYSATAWYLFGDPAVVDTFEIGYLRGRRTPTVETGTTDFDTLGMRFRVYFDLGIREQDYRGMVKYRGT